MSSTKDSQHERLLSAINKVLEKCLNSTLEADHMPRQFNAHPIVDYIRSELAQRN